MSVSSILIIVIAAFFFIKLFTANPLEGKWGYEDSDLTIQVKSNGTAVIQWPDELEGADLSVEMQYDVNKDAKIFVLRKNDAAVKAAAEKSEGSVTAEQVDSAVSSLEGSYEYNIERSQMTLTEREYGEQMVFTKE